MSPLIDSEQEKRQIEKSWGECCLSQLSGTTLMIEENHQKKKIMSIHLLLFFFAVNWSEGSKYYFCRKNHVFDIGGRSWLVENYCNTGCKVGTLRPLVISAPSHFGPVLSNFGPMFRTFRPLWSQFGSFVRSFRHIYIDTYTFILICCKKD